MTRFGLALVVVRSFALAVWGIALFRLDYAIWGVTRLFMAGTGWQPLIYLVIPTAVFLVGLFIWWTSGPIAIRIAGMEPDAPVGGFSTDEAVLMRVVFAGIGVLLIVSFLMRLPLIVLSWMTPVMPMTPGEIQQQVFRPSLGFIIQTGVLLGCGLVLLLGNKAVASLVIRLRKFD